MAFQVKLWAPSCAYRNKKIMTLSLGDCVSLFLMEKKKHTHTPLQGSFYCFSSIVFCLPFTYLICLTVGLWLQLAVCIPVRCALCLWKAALLVGSCKNGANIAALLQFLSAVLCYAALCVPALISTTWASVAANCLCYCASLEHICWTVSLQLSFSTLASCDCPYCFHIVQFCRKLPIRQLTVAIPILLCTESLFLAL